MADVLHVGVVADGPTDQDIIGAFVAALLGPAPELRILCLDQSLRKAMDRYLRSAGQGDYGLFSQHASKLQATVASAVFTAVGEMRSSAGQDVGCCDLLVLNTDAERHFNHADVYFSEWAYSVRSCVSLGVERFYHLALGRGWPFESLPLVLPLVLFPSTDILVAAARTDLHCRFAHYGKTARELKRALYGTEDLRELDEEALDREALSRLKAGACTAVYRFLPETRPLVRMLRWAKTFRGA